MPSSLTTPPRRQPPIFFVPCYPSARVPARGTPTMDLMPLVGVRLLTKTSTDIIFGLFFLWTLKYIYRGCVLDEFSREEEPCILRDARRLLHIVRHDDDSI